MNKRIVHHYDRQEGEKRVKEALAFFPRLDPHTLEETSLLDEFHVRGREGTLSLVQRLELKREDFVLDCGCGPGGTLRWIHGRYGCRVVGVDLSLPFVKVARLISQKYGMDKEIEYVVADALRLPFGDFTFSTVICQHVTMNIPDKGALFSEWGRVLIKGGKMGLNEIVKLRGEPDYPVPWAGDEEMSFLADPTEMREAIEQSGFHIVHFAYTTDMAMRWFEEATHRREKLNLKLLMGEEMGTMSRNLKDALKDGRLGVIELVARKAN